MDAKCPNCFGEKPDCSECNGSGFIDVKFAEGDLYDLTCTGCGKIVGGCITGEDTIPAPPKWTPDCVFCGAKTKYCLAEDLVEDKEDKEEGQE